MKQISLNQAIEFITANFSAVSILKTWSTKTTTEVLFQADGVQYELFSNLDAIFNSNNPFVIFEA